MNWGRVGWRTDGEGDGVLDCVASSNSVESSADQVGKLDLTISVRNLVLMLRLEPLVAYIRKQAITQRT